MPESSPNVIEVDDLHLTYTTATGRKINAVRGLSLNVRQGEVVGFIGPNGAGKSSTIKALLGFQKALRGTAKLFGMPAGDVRARRRIGYLPEVALYYPFLTAKETLALYAKLAEVPKAEREATITSLLAKVNLTGRENEPVRGYSKGMLQRVGIAQAIMGDPDLLILDEVTSGLDPVARFDVRKILLGFKSRGKTVFFSSHELTEVTMLCDRVIMIDEGKVFRESRLDDLLQDIEKTVVDVGGGIPVDGLPRGVSLHGAADGVQTFVVDGEEARDQLEEVVSRAGGVVRAVRREPGSLEEYFVSSIGHKVS